MFVDDEVICLRLELVNNIRIPCVADQNPTLPTVRGMNALPDIQRQLFQAVGRVRSAEVREVWTKSHFEINNFDAGVASRGQHFCDWGDSLSNAGNINASQVERAALSTEIVLHVYHDYRSLFDINRNRFGLCIDSDDPAVRVLSLCRGGFFAGVSN